MHVLLYSLPPTLQQATTDSQLCWRLLDTPAQVWVSFLWGCSYTSLALSAIFLASIPLLPSSLLPLSSLESLIILPLNFYPFTVPPGKNHNPDSM